MVMIILLVIVVVVVVGAAIIGISYNLKKRKASHRKVKKVRVKIT